MKNYERPQVFCQEDLCEGVYLASGDDNNDADVCKSIYIQGTWHKPDHGAYQGTNLYRFLISLININMDKKTSQKGFFAFPFCEVF